MRGAMNKLYFVINPKKVQGYYNKYSLWFKRTLDLPNIEWVNIRRD